MVQSSTYIVIGVLLIVAMNVIMGGPVQSFIRAGIHLYHDALEWPEHLLLAGIIMAVYGLYRAASTNK